MAFMDIINPWGALRDAQTTIKAQGERIDHLYAELNTLRNKLDERSLLATSRAIEITNLKRKMKSAHFRNPATGRLGRKGETF